MTSALVCDGPSCGSVGRPGSTPPVEAWWRLERYGLTFAIESSRPYDAERGAPVVSKTSFSTTIISAPEVEYEEDDDFEPAELVVDDDQEPDYLDTPPLHFCSAACLTAWATTAATMEDHP